MNRYALTLFAVVLCGTMSAIAKEDAVHVMDLAGIDELFSTCQRIDPSHAEQYLKTLTELTQTVRHDVLADARESREYRHARQAVQIMFAKFARQQTLNTCLALTGP